MKRYTYVLTLSLSLLIAALPSFVSAAGYVPLEPLPFLKNASNPSLPQLLQALFQLSLIAGAGLAVLMITIGGIQYMTGDALHQKQEGRSRIQGAVFGLILLIFIYLLLRTINPQLLNFDIGSITREKSGAQSSAAVQQAQAQSSAASPGPLAGAAAGASAGGNGVIGSFSGTNSGSGGQVLPGDYGDGGGFGGTSQDAFRASGYVQDDSTGVDAAISRNAQPDEMTAAGYTGTPQSGIATVTYKTQTGETMTSTEYGTCAGAKSRFDSPDFSFVSCK
jgi:hypothetical protein